jgi:hypothetical protein
VRLILTVTITIGHAHDCERAGGFDRRLLEPTVVHASGVAWALAVAGPALIGLASMPFWSSFGLGGGLFCMMLVVVAAAVTGGPRPALAAVAASVLAGAFFLAPPDNSLRVSRLGDGLALIACGTTGDPRPPPERRKARKPGPFGTRLLWAILGLEAGTGGDLR